eukprot:GHVH01010417.1.p1 GENE.GHVH01010417.1~~GHVH01010417.1.p1  ORF type:complete len:245 (+),score=23.32 GHVH01010417.1:198-932(+)
MKGEALHDIAKKMCKIEGGVEAIGNILTDFWGKFPPRDGPRLIDEGENVWDASSIGHNNYLKILNSLRKNGVLDAFQAFMEGEKGCKMSRLKPLYWTLCLESLFLEKKYESCIRIFLDSSSDDLDINQLKELSNAVVGLKDKNKGGNKNENMKIFDWIIKSLKIRKSLESHIFEYTVRDFSTNKNTKQKLFKILKSWFDKEMLTVATQHRSLMGNKPLSLSELMSPLYNMRSPYIRTYIRDNQR